ncbi:MULTISPECIES: ABC transporter ATP-binding protein [Bifidobacterium]|uniref:ABC transporter, ATP-binding protein n=1 Tax=Bifidobacterium animalis subsp. lactis (strain AD011) TaxID=442563 RepID=B8DUB0_BIFA0|nr:MULTISPECIES: ABC transporter A family member [Bifidobacterium]ADC85801.2 ATP-binding cassette domain-containing protein [Bifidobacterium animalis subsp. lactis BB-12]MCB8546679.1 ABC transporter A subfamily ATP-binding protein [Bifidobacterium sp. MSK23_125]MCB8553122.1 ABC transporter A subfamily ATP-binding protein [Bifidobacterium sp. MSK23_139]HJI95542.1 ABC transporter A subfamily ATP-binding protein [Bifidobacteriaceae bacterium]ACL29589.1 ABC transporter, ATP-binding protein [Bifido
MTKTFGSLTAVDKLNLTVAQGETFALLGVNGAGKTTTISMLCGLTKPTSGNAYLLGESVLTDAKRIKPQINLSPQETAVAPNLSVTENLRLIAGIYGQSAQQAKASTQQALDEFGLNAVASQKAHTLSGGMQRRLSIAMGLITNPKILFLDEPTVGLDIFARRELWNVIKGLKGRVTILLTTHYLEEVEALADRIAIMVAGRTIAIGTVAELKKQTGENNLEDAFVKLVGGNNELA